MKFSDIGNTDTTSGEKKLYAKSLTISVIKMKDKKIHWSLYISENQKEKIEEKLRRVYPNLESFSDLMRKHFEDFLKAKKSIGSSEVLTPDDDYFNCTKFCKKQRMCNSPSRNILSEIIENGCYVGTYPYKYKGHRVCKFMQFETHENDPEHPFPKCIARQKDLPVQLPKDHIMRDPQFCWKCYKIRKYAREKKDVDARVKAEQRYGSRSRVNWGKAEGSPDLWRLGSE